MDDYGEENGWEEAAQLSPTEDRRDNDTIIQDIQQVFASKDMVMEPDVFSYIRRYFLVGGPREELVKLLSENYCGIAQSANLLANWLILTGSNVHDVEQLVENHLKDLIIKHFDPKRADSIFTEAGETPSWLEGMIAHPTWRSMFYKLSEQYPECLMLNFTIKLISDAGHQAEITSVSTACHQIEVFSRVLKTSVEGFVEEGEMSLESNLPEFSKMVCYGQHTYLYAQCLLNLVAQEPHAGAKVKRVSQEVMKSAVEGGHDITQITLCLNGSPSYPRVCSGLSSMLGKNALNPGDITVLYKLFTSPQPPPCDLIRIPQFLDLLLDALFKPGQHIHSEHKFKYTYLLAYASCVHEAWQDGKRVLLNRDELKATTQAVEKAHTLCMQDSSGAGHLISEVKVLFQCIRYPVVAMGILKWIDCTVSDPSFFKLMTDSTPVHLALLDELITCHPLQHRLVLNLLIRLFESDTPLDTLVELEFKKTVLDRMIHMLSRGYVIPVISFIHKCMTGQITDNSLIRHFVTEVLEMIAPPYSSEFVQLFLPIVRNEEITGSLRSSEGTDDASAFIAHCSRPESILS
ncbi:negative elongation factor D [Nematostella vectensis]|uniref:negative elongation factor D n=1 Tax=Nematostella vectensis TaxID=45351 RepID=UPI0013902D27|nr:negative elongation factor D [Nematostella vectensis]